MDYYTKNPPTAGCVFATTMQCHPAYTPQQVCAVKKAAEDDERRKKEEMFRMIVLSCQAGSVTYTQAAACVGLATGQ
jgi:hypothetical protein